MSMVNIGDHLINILDIAQTVNDINSAVDNYVADPNLKTSAALIKIASTQLAGQIIGFYLDKFFPEKGLDVVFASLKNGFNSPISKDDFVAQRAFKKAAAGYIIGKFLEKGVDAAAESECFGKMLSPIFKFIDNTIDTISSILGLNPDPLVKTIHYVRVDPLILDLDGDGLEISPLSKGILFDADGDGIKNATAWAGADDGMLVWDRNGNGAIDSGQEMFGDQTIKSDGTLAKNGFDALADLDSNGDGVFDANDADYANLRVWRDLNQDGISQEGELFTLDALGIASISLKSATANTSYGDATLTQKGIFTRTDGSTGQTGSFVLSQSSFVREFATITISAAARALPNLQGSGWVRDLQEAATLSSLRNGKDTNFDIGANFAFSRYRNSGCAFRPTVV